MINKLYAVHFYTHHENTYALFKRNGTRGFSNNVHKVGWKRIKGLIACLENRASNTNYTITVHSIIVKFEGLQQESNQNGKN